MILFVNSLLRQTSKIYDDLSVEKHIASEGDATEPLMRANKKILKARPCKAIYCIA